MTMICVLRFDLLHLKLKHFMPNCSVKVKLNKFVFKFACELINMAQFNGQENRYYRNTCQIAAMDANK